MPKERPTSKKLSSNRRNAKKGGLIRHLQKGLKPRKSQAKR